MAMISRDEGDVMGEGPARSAGWRAWARRLAIAIPVALLVAAVWVAPAYVPLIPPTRRRQVVEGFLRTLLVGYAATWLIAPAATLILAGFVARSRRRKIARPKAARSLLLAVSCLLSLILLETASAAWRAWAHRMPALPLTTAEGPEGGRARIVVIGGSSALGEPYRPWVSVGQIIARQLEAHDPKQRRFDVEILARLGASLEDMHKALAGLTRRPDVLIVYSGHNEFSARFEEERDAFLDEEPTSRALHRLYRLSLQSPFCRLVYETISRHRLDEPPLSGHHQLADPPVCTPSESAEILADFRRRLEAITSYCDRIGCLPVLIIPPSNEGGFEPSRSVLDASTDLAGRRRALDDFRRARHAEASPSIAIPLYRQALARHPEFAESHFRLARLLERLGSWREANEHYIRARDLDGLPIRCTTAFQDAIREVARNHDCILIDGPAEFRRASPRGIIDGRTIQDAHHPNLFGQVVLARAVLRELRARRRPFGIAAEGGPIDPAGVAAHFGLDGPKWAEVCNRTSIHYRRVAGYRYDPAERLRKADAYAEAARRIAAGTPVDEVGLVGLGTRSPGMIAKDP